MADKLTVDSPGSGGAAAVRGEQAPTKSEAQVELENLRDLAKSRGRNLSDEQLLAIATRHKAKLQEKESLKTSQHAFESGQAKESVKTKDTTRAQLQQATGAEAGRSVKDGLTAQDRKAITSNPDAGPKLPPAGAEAPKPDDAKKLVLELLKNFQLNGKPFDLATYAPSLRKLPPSQPPATKSDADKPTTPRPTPQPFAKTPTFGQRSSALTAGAPTAPTFRAGGSRTEGSTASALRSSGANLGGGLTSGTSFDGMNFNWDAFFTLFTMKSQEDLQAWKQALRQLRQLEHRVAMSGHELGIALLKMRQSFQVAETMTNVMSKTLEGAQKANDEAVKNQASRIAGADPAKSVQDLKDMRAALADKPDDPRSKDSQGRLLLTDEEIKNLPDDRREKYRQAQESYRRNAGPLGETELLRREIQARGGDPSKAAPDEKPPIADLRKQLGEREQMLGKEMQSASGNKDVFQELMRRRASLGAALKDQVGDKAQVLSQAKQALETFKSGPDAGNAATKAKLEGDVTTAQSELDTALADYAAPDQAAARAQLAAMNRMLKTSLPRNPETNQAMSDAMDAAQVDYEKALEELATATPANRPAAEEKLARAAAKRDATRDLMPPEVAAENYQALSEQITQLEKKRPKNDSPAALVEHEAALAKLRAELARSRAAWLDVPASQRPDGKDTWLEIAARGGTPAHKDYAQHEEAFDKAIGRRTELATKAKEKPGLTQAESQEFAEIDAKIPALREEVRRARLAIAKAAPGSDARMALEAEELDRKTPRPIANPRLAGSSSALQQAKDELETARKATPPNPTRVKEIETKVQGLEKNLAAVDSFAVEQEAANALFGADEKAKIIADADPEQWWDDFNDVVGKIDNFADAFVLGPLAKGAQAAQEAGDSAGAEALAMAHENKARAAAMTQRAASQSQGMINQLIAIMGMGRQIA